MSYDDRMDPNVIEMLEMQKISGLKKLYDLPVELARKQYLKNSRVRKVNKTKIGFVDDFLINSFNHEIPCRLYKPYGYMDLKLLPLLLYFHGGGHVVGGLDTHDELLRNICSLADCACLSVDYRLAPEHKFPAAVEDAIESLEWVISNSKRLGIDKSKIALGGDSAGGNLAAVTVLSAREIKGFNLCFQLLIYPVVDMTFSFPSHHEFGLNFGILDTKTDHWFREHYIPDNLLWTDWRASPLFASSLKKLPPTLIILAELDMLIDEGKAFHQKIIDSKNKSELVIYKGMIHGFFNASGFLDSAKAAQVRCARTLRKSFYG